ncbi:MAG: right-handed parallel beta-helix repeat-containing protein, partial [Spirochaetia bacterium]|nr:right-handed parallel beta-helix repeat-containing protein [Spirochaetia bacterium]
MSKPIHKTLLGCFASSLILILFDCRNASLTDPMNSDRSKISSAAGLAAAPTAYLDITGSPYNAVPNDNTDDTAAINQCAADAKAQGKGVYIPNGEFRHSGVLIFDSVDVVGQSASGAKLLATAPATASCKMLGTLAKVRNLSLVGTATSRSQADSSCGILASSVANITISGVVISGMAGAGMKLNNVNGGTVSGNAVTGTFADGIHMTEKSRNLVVQNNSVTGTGDDCISIVSYV